MARQQTTRSIIIDHLIRTLEPLASVHALWEAGAASFDRIDQWSDLDLYVVVQDEVVEDTFSSIEQALSVLSEIDARLRLPEPTWHGHSQAFYRLKDASPFLFLDIVVMKRSSRDKFLQYRIHGKPVVHFDKIGIVRDESVDPESFHSELLARLAILKTKFELFQVLVLKELNRGNYIEALSYYILCTYRPLVEVLRMKYCPYHHDFFTSYIYYDLPENVVKRLHCLYFVPDHEQLETRRVQAEAWFWETVRSIDRDDLRRRISASAPD